VDDTRRLFIVVVLVALGMTRQVEMFRDLAGLGRAVIEGVSEVCENVESWREIHGVITGDSELADDKVRITTIPHAIVD
jgi:hypothetical protein